MAEHPGGLPRGSVTAEDADGLQVNVSAGGRAVDYPVMVERGLMERLPSLVRDRAPAHRYAVVSDETVAALYGRSLATRLNDIAPTRLWTFPAGERSKSRESWMRLTDEMLEEGLGRDTVLVAVGGGVTGDLAGFVAATFLRGIPVVQVPTSLVAMIDASVGGKTGIDLPRGKNLVGAFHPPLLVAADPDVVATLPRAERSQGLAEALKHGAILDAEHFEWIHRMAGELLEGEGRDVQALVGRSVALKADVVSRDEREGGLRQVLNFGHTLGHAIEASSGYRLPHGSAVAAGMVLEARLGERMGVTAEGTSRRLGLALEELELPSAPPTGLRAADVRAFLGQDKKVRLGKVRVVLLRQLGEVARDPEARWSWTAEEGVLDEVISEAFG